MHQIYYFNTLTNVLKRAALIGEHMIEILYDTNRQTFITTLGNTYTQ